MRDAIRTGIALICLTIAACLALVFSLAYARNEGWFDNPGERSIFIQPELDAPESDDAAHWS
ncbi:hypothetical protein [Hyphobacterium sp.]|uniref:hypothetical protein n=1 Tax=Hyphobacterium sp. TaxID=2004662 RepID=UPI0037482DB0